MEYLISIFLGWVAVQLQGKRTKKLSRRWRFAISIIACLFAGLAVSAWGIFIEGSFDETKLLASFGLAFGTSQAYYNLYFKK